MKLQSSQRYWHVVVLILLLTPTLVFAELIIPGHRVSTHLNVREQADSSSRIVGKLEHNESAELIRSVPYWYEIRLSTGQTGFVSKDWAETASNTDSTGQVIRLGSWNIKKLGHGDKKDYALVAQVIESNFDIMALVEVMQKQQAHPGYEALLPALGREWSGQVTTTPRPNTESGNDEFYAVVYRNTVIRPCAGWSELRYYPDNEGSANGIGVDAFSREPAFGCYEAPLNSAHVGVDFLLAAYHAVSQGNAGVTGVQAEIANLPQVFQSMAAARPGESDLFIAGDFNVTHEQLQKKIPMGDRTTGSGSTLNSYGGLSANLFDHLLVYDESASQELAGDAEVLDVRGVAANDAIFYQTISDHLPIRIRVRASGPDDD